MHIVNLIQKDTHLDMIRRFKAGDGRLQVTFDDGWPKLGTEERDEVRQTLDTIAELEKLKLVEQTVESTLGRYGNFRDGFDYSLTQTGMMLMNKRLPKTLGKMDADKVKALISDPDMVEYFQHDLEVDQHYGQTDYYNDGPSYDQVTDAHSEGHADGIALYADWVKNVLARL